MTSERHNTERRRNRRDNVSDTGIDARCVRRQLQHRTARIERREVGKALSKLETQGSLTDEQRQTVRLLGGTLALRLIANFESPLNERTQNKQATARAVARLFDLIPESHFDNKCEQP
jgi:hypothetical protein